MSSKSALSRKLEEKDNELHERLVKFISEIYGQLPACVVTNGGWSAKVKHGTFVIDILHTIGERCITVALNFELDTEAQNILKSGVQGVIESREFEYGLRSTLTFPDTFYFIHTVKSADGANIWSGFVVGATLFPYSPDFSVYILQKAIQNVVNASTLGMGFLGLKLMSNKAFMDFLDELKSSPGEMYQ